MSRTNKIPQSDDEVKVTQKKKTIKLKTSKPIITKDMIAEAAYYKAEQRGFALGFEEHDWLEAESELSTV